MQFQSQVYRRFIHQKGAEKLVQNELYVCSNYMYVTQQL